MTELIILEELNYLNKSLKEQVSPTVEADGYKKYIFKGMRLFIDMKTGYSYYRTSDGSRGDWAGIYMRHPKPCIDLTATDPDNKVQRVKHDPYSSDCPHFPDLKQLVEGIPDKEEKERLQDEKRKEYDEKNREWCNKVETHKLKIAYTYSYSISSVAVLEKFVYDNKLFYGTYYFGRHDPNGTWNVGSRDHSGMRYGPYGRTKAGCLWYLGFWFSDFSIMHARSDSDIVKFLQSHGVNKTSLT